MKTTFKEHTQKEHTLKGMNLRDFIFGAEDGLIGGLGLVTGVSAAAVGQWTVVLSGIALMLTQAISMSAGVFLSVRSQREVYEHALAKEVREIEEVPDIEREEIRQIYKAKGFSGAQLEGIVKKITSDKKVWLDVMMAEELGLTDKGLENQWKAAGVMALSEIAGVIVPLTPYLLIQGELATTVSMGATIVALFVFGGAKGLFTGRSWIKSGLEMLAVGLVAAVAGLAIGSMFSVVV